MNNSGNILIVDDEEFIQLNLKNILSEENFNIFVENNGKSALSIIEQEQIDLAFLDLNLPDMHGLEVLKRIKQVQPEMLVIIMTGYASVESAVDAIKLGAYDYIKKPFKADAIKLITKLGFDALNLKRKVKQLEDERHKGKTLDSILGNSEAINEVKEQIKEYAKYETETVLITGESGSGKELAGMAIHYLSPRADKEFVEINCASIPDNLLESELFGYEKGAFTDASKAKEGLFEKANGGTLFLDEIGEMSLPLQAKLLRVLENKRFRRLGSTKDKEVNVRVIAATNKDLIKAIEAGEFRQDLYFRLDVLRISMPPLRKRGNDVELLANYFLHYFATKFGKNIQGFHQSALDTMKRYDWPGNV
ncbi:MAG: sigma-54-dependent Fis family transcriptional regulator, partial [Ignavibacteria bacterium]